MPDEKVLVEKSAPELHLWQMITHRHVDPEERKLLDRIAWLLREIDMEIFVYPFFDHKVISPDVAKLLKELEPLLSQWKKKYAEVI